MENADLSDRRVKAALRHQIKCRWRSSPLAVQAAFGNSWEGQAGEKAAEEDTQAAQHKLCHCSRMSPLLGILGLAKTDNFQTSRTSHINPSSLAINAGLCKNLTGNIPS